MSLWPAHHRLHKSQFQDDDLAALGKSLCLLDGILDGQVGLPGVRFDLVVYGKAVSSSHLEKIATKRKWV